MLRFEDKFVHFRWTDDLEGKRAFYADSIDQLENSFTACNRGHLHKSESEDYPFEVACEGNWKFIYFDPNYECKVAYEQGKQIQCRNKKLQQEWIDADSPCWGDEYEYRVKPAEDYYYVIIVSDKLAYVPARQVTGQHVFFRGSSDACHNYIVTHEKYTECMVAYLNNKKIQNRAYGSHDWADVSEPVWCTDYEYRVKPGLTWADLKLGDAVRQFDGAIISMVTAFDMAEGVRAHVQLAGWGWIGDSELAEKWFKI